MKKLYYFFLKLILSYLFIVNSNICLAQKPILKSKNIGPIIIPAYKIEEAQGHLLKDYRLIVCNKKGEAIEIPFQLDEKDPYDDFIMHQGPIPNSQFSNHIFDSQDELSFMARDIGENRVPDKWPFFSKPRVLYRIKITRPGEQNSVFLGVYTKNPPPLSQKKYVDFNIKKGEISTTKYFYNFYPKNYLVVDGIKIKNKTNKLTDAIYSSSFYLKLDLKYFLTFTSNETDIDSKLEAYRIGPVRAMARVSFTYRLLRLNIDMGMYTEVSFFDNAVILPAVFESPVEGKKVLNSGSQFYYGFAFNINPKNQKTHTNMSPFGSGVSSKVIKYREEKRNNWSSIQAENYLVLLKIGLSEGLIKQNIIPKLYLESNSGQTVMKRSSGAEPLGESRVNTALSLDISSVEEGQHKLSFNVYVDNTPENLKSYMEFNPKALNFSASKVPIKKVKK